MTITTRDQLINAMANNSSRLIIDKAGLSNVSAGAYFSSWRASGQPVAAAVPTAVTVLDHNTLGSISFTQQTNPNKSYLANLDVALSVANTLEIHDRLCQMGGLNGTLTTSQTVGMDLDSLLSTSNLSERIGDANYSDVQWWLEWYSDTGATVVTATVNVTYTNGTTGNLIPVSLAATRRGGFCQSLNVLNPSTATGLFIRGVNSVTLSATTGTAGNFGITASRYRAGVFAPLGNNRYSSDWAQLGLPEIPNSSCLYPLVLMGTGSSTGIRATGKIAHG